MGHVTFVIRRLGLAMINFHAKFEVFMFSHYKDMKGNATCGNWGGLGVWVTFDRVRTTCCSTLIETIRLSCTVFE